MRVVIKIFPLVALLLSQPFFLQAQKVWTLQECIDYAMKNNLTVQQGVLDVKGAKVNKELSYLSAMPSVNGFATNNYNFGRSIDPFTNTFTNQQIRNNNLGLNSSVTLFNGLQTQNNIKQQELLYKASQYDLDLSRNNISLAIANAYLSVLLNQEILGAAALQADNTRRQVERTEKLVQAGTLAVGPLLDLKAQMANEELSVVNARNQVQLAYLTLWQLLALPYDERNTIAKPDINSSLPGSKSEDPFINQVFSTYASRGPEIMSAETKLKAALIGLRVARGGRSPRLTLNGSISSTFSESSKRSTGSQVLGTRVLYKDVNNNDVVAPYVVSTGLEVTPFNTQMRDNLGKSLGLTLSIPLLNGWSVNSNIERSKVNYERARLGAEQVRNQVYQDITRAAADLKAAKARYEAAQNSYEAVGNSFRNAEQRFTVGAMNFTDYSLAKNNFMRAEATMLQARYELVFRQKVLDFYNGKPIAL